MRDCGTDAYSSVSVHSVYHERRSGTSTVPYPERCGFGSLFDGEKTKGRGGADTDVAACCRKGRPCRSRKERGGGVGGVEENPAGKGKVAVVGECACRREEWNAGGGERGDDEVSGACCPEEPCPR